MKIMVIPTGYPSDDNRATMLFVYEQAKALANAGNEVSILHVQRQPSRMLLKKVDTRIQVLDDGFATRYFTRLKTFAMHTFPRLLRHNFEKKMRQLFLYARERGEQPDVIYAHFSCWAGCAAIKIGQEFHIPVVTMEHYSEFISGKKMDAAYTQGLKETLAASDRMLCVSDRLKTAIGSITGMDRPIRVIPNMVDEHFVYHVPQQHDGFRFCTLGHLKPRKRIAFLVEAFCKAFSADENVSLWIGGDGAERDRIEKVIADHGREKQIHMQGRLSREQSVKLFTDSDCFVLPSAGETFGLVYREAMGIGRPVITTDHGGWDADNWSDEFGIRIPVDDMDQLIRAMKKMVRDYDGYDLQRISNYVQEHYSSVVIAAQILEELSAAVEGYDGKEASNNLV